MLDEVVESSLGTWIASNAEKANFLALTRHSTREVVRTADLGLPLPDQNSPVQAKFESFPTETLWPKLEVVQGGGTVRTYQMPAWAERCQMILTTNGRPLKAKVELWLGPERTTHTLIIDSEDGLETPVQATLKFKKMSQVLKISSNDDGTFPLFAAVSVPPKPRAAALAENFEAVWDSTVLGDYPEAERKLVQGGEVSGKDGAVRVWTVPEHVQSVQLLATSKNTGKKSLKVEFDVLQGPNNRKQSFFLQCGGGSQPYTMVVQTPGSGCTILLKNKKSMEDGNVQIAIVPYDVPID